MKTVIEGWPIWGLLGLWCSQKLNTTVGLTVISVLHLQVVGMETIGNIMQYYLYKLILLSISE